MCIEDIVQSYHRRVVADIVVLFLDYQEKAGRYSNAYVLEIIDEILDQCSEEFILSMTLTLSKEYKKLCDDFA